LERAAILRTADNKITELRADIGGVLGLGQREIALPAARFSLQNDRVVLDLTAAQAKDLPKVTK
jgi:PRC-barrel domain